MHAELHRRKNMKTDMPLLIAIDIDDTLLPKSKIVDKNDKLAIQAARDAGVFVTLATGRGFLGSKPVIDELDLSGPVINYGGAIISDAKTGKLLHADSLPPEYVCELLLLADELGVHSHLYQGDAIIYRVQNEYPIRYAAALGLPSVIDPDADKKRWENTPKVLYMTTTENVERLYPMLKRRYEGKLEVALSSPGFIEFNMLGSNKGSALKWVADKMGIPREHIIAMGDNTLDREMLLYAGVGIAVDNARDEIKAIADDIAPPCGGAVCAVIEKYLNITVK